MNTVLALLGMALASASVIGSIAYVCAKRQLAAPFAGSVILAWAIAAWAIGYYTQVMSLMPERIPEWRRIVDSFLSIAPLVVVPAAFALAAVVGKVAVGRIPLLATAGAVLSLPLTFAAAVASSCYIALDCL